MRLHGRRRGLATESNCLLPRIRLPAAANPITYCRFASVATPLTAPTPLVPAPGAGEAFDGIHRRLTELTALAAGGEGLRPGSTSKGSSGSPKLPARPGDAPPSPLAVASGAPGSPQTVGVITDVFACNRPLFRVDGNSLQEPEGTGAGAHHGISSVDTPEAEPPDERRDERLDERLSRGWLAEDALGESSRPRGRHDGRKLSIGSRYTKEIEYASLLYHQPSLMPPAMARSKGAEVHDVQLSKRLTKLLRHKALEHGVEIDRDGWASVADALHYANSSEANALWIGPAPGEAGEGEDGDHEPKVPKRTPTPKGQRWVEEDVREMIHLNNKTRFELRERPEDGELQIRATQGHTMSLPGLRGIMTGLTPTLEWAASFTWGPGDAGHRSPRPTLDDARLRKGSRWSTLSIKRVIEASASDERMTSTPTSRPGSKPGSHKCGSHKCTTGNEPMTDHV